MRGDYVSTFRSGAVIVVMLDTDVGSVSFGLWGEDGVEDWGVAFEGLPLNVKLFPAVGLYQRDDKVTLLSISEDHAGKERRGVLDGGEDAALDALKHAQVVINNHSIMFFASFFDGVFLEKERRKEVS